MSASEWLGKRKSGGDEKQTRFIGNVDKVRPKNTYMSNYLDIPVAKQINIIDIRQDAKTKNY